MGRYEILDSVAIADCALQIEAADLADLFETAARALAETMVDPATIARDLEQSVHLSASTLDLLLFDWLGEIIALKDSEGAAFPDVRAQVEVGNPCTLCAQLLGGSLRTGTAALRSDPKAVTFHMFRLAPCAAGWSARVVIDT